jgi:site-specific DNA-methyltransferase (adenine-specific)
MNNLYFGNTFDMLAGIADESVDAVITDPPYLYLDHELDAQFDEELLFKECYRILKPNSMLVFFGRGDSYYEWNIICKRLGFKFKEELIWEKQTSSPFMAISRCHETISVRSKGNKSLNEVRINPYINDKLNGQEDWEAHFKEVIKTVKEAPDDPHKCLEYINNVKKGTGNYTKEHKTKHYITTGAGTMIQPSHISNTKKYFVGAKLQTVIRVSRETYIYAHPTQKPVALMQRLIKLITQPGDIIVDPFMGGGSTGVAAVQLGRQFIGAEILEEYYKTAVDRITSTQPLLDSSILE